MMHNLAFQPTRYDSPPLAAGNGLRSLCAGRSYRHAFASD
jgi:hypothetical protein